MRVISRLVACDCTPENYNDMPMLYTVIFLGYKKHNFQMKNCVICLPFPQNIDRGYTLEPPQVQTSTHNLCFEQK